MPDSLSQKKQNWMLMFPPVPLRIYRSAACALLAACVVGCGSRSSGPAMKPITATVTYKGAPVADATVTFISEGSEPVSAFGKTDAQGVVKPTTPQLGEGVVLGTHKVLVAKEESEGGRFAAGPGIIGRIAAKRHRSENQGSAAGQVQSAGHDTADRRSFERRAERIQAGAGRLRFSIHSLLEEKKPAAAVLAGIRSTGRSDLRRRSC